METIYLQNQLILPSSRALQAISTCLQNKATTSQQDYREVLDEEEADLAAVMPAASPVMCKKRGRPPNN